MAKYYDRHREHSPRYSTGDQVWLNLENYPSARPSKKLDDKWAGPFKVVKIVSPNAIKLALSGRVRGVHPVVPTASIRRYSTGALEGRVDPPPPKPIDVDGQEEMEIERILDCKRRYRRFWYLVKFKGWPDSENEWIPLEELTHAKESVEDFHLEHPDAARPNPEVPKAFRSSRGR